MISWLGSDDRSGARLSSFLLEGSGDAVFIADAAGIIREANPAAERVFACSRNEIVGAATASLFRDLLPPLVDGTAVHTLARARRSDGTFLPVALSRLRVREGAETVVVALVRDMQERASALEEAEKRYQVVFRASPDAIILSRGRDGLMVDVNEGFLALTGFAREEVIGRTALELGIWADPTARLRLVEILREKGKVDNFESKFRCKDGRIASAVMSARALKLHGVPHLVTITRSIEELKRTQNSLRASEERFRIISEASPVGITMTKLSDGTFLFSNALFAHWVGIDPSDLLARRSTEFYQDPAEREMLLREIRRHGKAENLELHLKSASGEALCALFSAHPMDFRGEPVLLCACANITARKASEDALRRAKEEAEIANRTKSDFLAHMSHELRTPLNSVIGFAELLESETFGPLGSERNREYVGDIKSSGSHLLRLINEILDVSQIEVGMLKAQEEEVAIVEVVGACLSMIRQRAAEKGVTLSADLPAGPLALRADATALKRILLNLLSNAIKFTPPGGRAGVEVRCDTEGRLVLEVVDTGIGIAPEDIPRILEPFSQIRDIMTSSRGGGVGLGLFLVRSLAEIYGAALTIDSAPGKGTSVTVVFPAERTLMARPADGPMKRPPRIDRRHRSRSSPARAQG